MTRKVPLEASFLGAGASGAPPATAIPEPWWRPNQWGNLPGGEAFVDRESGDFVAIFRERTKTAFGQAGVREIDWKDLEDEVRMVLHGIFERIEERVTHEQAVNVKNVVREAVQGALEAINPKRYVGGAGETWRVGPPPILGGSEYDGEAVFPGVPGFDTAWSAPANDFTQRREYSGLPVLTWDEPVDHDPEEASTSGTFLGDGPFTGTDMAAPAPAPAPEAPKPVLTPGMVGILRSGSPMFNGRQFTVEAAEYPNIVALVFHGLPNRADEPPRLYVNATTHDTGGPEKVDIGIISPPSNW